MQHTKSRYFFLILILGSLTALAPFSIDMYLPGFGAIAKDLNTNVEEVGLSLSSFFIGISAGQLLYGPLLDKYGRKKPLYLGLLVYIIATIGCVLSTSIQSLIWLRFIQAIGSCAATVAAMAMVRDLFPVQDNAKVFALLMLVVGASPMIAPTAGGYITKAFGWHSVFIILAILGAVILVAVLLSLPESYQPDPSYSLKPGPIVTNFLQVLKEPQFYTYAATGALGFSGLFVYVSGSPKAFMDIYQLSGEVYGWIFAFLSIGFIGSSQVNTLLLKRFRSQQIVPVALVCQSAAGVLLVTTALAGVLTLPVLLILLFLFLCCLGFVNPNTAALSLAPFAKNAGSASALMGAIQMGLGALASASLSLFTAKNVLPMVALMACSAVLALAVLLLGRRKIKNEVAGVEGAVVLH
ncbi:MFS transporter, DHA1 family, bicyclomycin/chloramphenicol resistance protein [Filimonas lacunae]|uniref:MFS transporter, DHA1 family, bicyclomycin/chloramphenicol resistance protein n=1 Tax=Filimonas lacunae TaxID=477680 RepID=A0A173MAE3_9BACT|nr:multidrug effflux MFS transporter [Filimonas lacunae]BAV04502.1 multidrug resistance transporter, Bcr/CflA family [Filimonas lacunae]SIT31604.1 MFS transporter, DHA1 family, bicyclomycin/chloramphenicol resistance protein [Filimonas lacunae]